MLADLSYLDALEAAPEPHVVILGPVPCHRCGAWVEWAGVSWTGFGSKAPHDCVPFMRVGQNGRLERRDGPRPAIRPRSGVVHVEPLELLTLPRLPWRLVSALLLVIAVMLGAARLGMGW